MFLIPGCILHLSYVHWEPGLSGPLRPLDLRTQMTADRLYNMGMRYLRSSVALARLHQRTGFQSSALGGLVQIAGNAGSSEYTFCMQETCDPMACQAKITCHLTLTMGLGEVLSGILLSSGQRSASGLPRAVPAY